MATNEEKIKIASKFLKAAPPDVRTLVGDDELLEGGILSALEEYNIEELATVDVPGIEGKAIVSKHGHIEGDRFLHPKTNQTFKLDHLRQTASEVEAHTIDEEVEDLRKAIEVDAEAYAKDRYTEGVAAIYGSKGVITFAIVHNKYSPSNYWNGRWRSIWTLDVATNEVKGVMKCKVHYYEDGNVQLETSKELEDKLSKGPSEPNKVIAKAFVDFIGAAESKYQHALNESYHDLAESTFNGLRRALPYTRTKLDWNKILTYRIGAELAAKLMSDYEVTLVNDNMQEFYVRFYGPSDTPFAGGIWKVHVELPDQYPYKSPSIGFMNKIFHPNIDELSGSVCLDVINQTWSPMFDMINIFEVFLPQLLRYPNPTDPLNGEAAAMLMREASVYELKVKEYVSRYATKEAAEDATDESSSDDDMSSVESFSDDDDAPGLEL
ncbi:hypothetical protein FBU30_008267 [Linnemannia zychae]|nr:hypothetical protein FBU30_008267 [Linnemannia zychae]